VAEATKRHRHFCKASTKGPTAKACVSRIWSIILPMDTVSLMRIISWSMRFAAFCMAVGCASAGTIEAVVWQNGSVTPLGAGSSSEAFAVNQAGDIAGEFVVGSAEHAFLWKGGTLKDLGPGSARGINGSDQVVGGFGDSAILWNQNGANLLPAFGTDTSAFAFGINNAGQVVGVSTAAANNQLTSAHALLWVGNTATDLGHLPGDFGAVALAINSQGDIVGYSIGPTFGRTPVIWHGGVIAKIPADGRDANAINDLGDVAGDMFYFSGGTIVGLPGDGFGVNELGMVAGTSFPGGFPPSAFLWQHGSATGLPALPGFHGHPQSAAFGINDSGQIVGYSDSADPAPESSTSLLFLVGLLILGWGNINSRRNHILRSRPARTT
jgi:probable HAF family extracellular repeat protein